MPAHRTAQKVLGIVAFVLGLLTIVPVVIVLILAAVLEPEYLWFLLVVLPFTLFIGVAGVLVGIAGLIVAGVRKGGWAWPIVGTAVALVGGLLPLLPTMLSGAL